MTPSPARFKKKKKRKNVLSSGNARRRFPLRTLPGTFNLKKKKKKKEKICHSFFFSFFFNATKQKLP
jgi:hypothetical protein